MKCNRCYTITQQILCDTCYRENIKHNEEKRSFTREKYELSLENFMIVEQENSAFIENILKENKRAKANCIHKKFEEKLETSSYEIDAKMKQGKVLEQKILIRRMCVKKINEEASYIKSKVQLKVKELELINIQSKKCRQKIVQQLTQHFQGICEYLKGNELTISRQEWDKFLNMGEQEQTMYATLSEEEVCSIPNNTHRQLKKQIVSLINLSKLLRIQLPYDIDEKLILGSKSQDIFINESRNIRIQLLRQLQANTQYLFSRYGIQMDYPQINQQSIRKLLQEFTIQKLHIYSHNYDGDDDILTKGIYISSADNLNINQPILQLSLDYLTEYKGSKLIQRNYKHSKQQQTSQGIDLLDIILLQGLSSVYSDEDIQILQ